MLKRPKNPDYELQEMIEVGRPDQFRAFGDATRQKILGLLAERAATTSQLAEALDQPKGSVAHHLKVLEGAELIRVVRTRRVRALTEKFYGRVARVFKFVDTRGEVTAEPFVFFRHAMGEYDPPPAGESPAARSVIRHARVPYARAEEFFERLQALAEEFASEEPSPGERVYGMVGGVYLTDWPELGDLEEKDSGKGE